MMAETVNGALVEARRQQAEIRSTINDLSNNDHSVRLSEWKATHKQAKSNHTMALGAVGAAEKRLSELETEGTNHLRALDRAQESLKPIRLVRQRKRRLKTPAQFT